ncbi:MAG: MATE family efflux transporter [Oscillospiraceae bacterium]|nr:MATE family efflux transporter [Oscillospiraceae bacterium]MBP1556424.1 MATE family efflux transporter [Oscillospiraceae bacterium]
MLTVCSPLALYQALQTIFKILDALMASHISSNAVSAVACLNQITLMITAIGGGLAVGGCIKLSEAYGKGDYDTVRRQVATLYAMSIMVSLAIMVVLIPFAEFFLRILNTPESLIKEGAGYFRVEILSLIVSFFNTVYIAIEKSRGHTQKILRLNMMIIFIKLSLSALFVYVMNCEVIMIAVATLVSQAALLIYAVFSMARDDGAFKFGRENIHFKRETVSPIVHLAYPVAAEKVLFAAGKVIVNSMSGMYGGVTVGALGISNNIGGLTTSWQSGMFDGASSLISQNRGAKKYRRTLELYYSLPVLAQIFAQSKNNFDPAFCEMIISIHRWEMLGYITLGFNSATLALLLGYGKAKLTLILNVLRVFAFRVPVLWYFQNFTQLGTEAVGLTMMVSNVCAGLSSLVVAIPVVMQIKKLIREQEAAET